MRVWLDIYDPTHTDIVTDGPIFVRSAQVRRGLSGAVRRWGLVPLVLALGFGSHAITHALTSSEPSLAKLGLSPIAYALLSSVVPRARQRSVGHE